MAESWIRARSPDQIDVRTQEILTAAKRLLVNQRFDDITFVKIAEEVSFTRSNLYRYFPTKEEIFLEILKNDLTEWVDNLDVTLGTDPLEAEEFAVRWIDSLLEQPRALGLLAILTTKLEAQSSVDALVAFKTRMSDLYRREASVVRSVIPSLATSDTYKLLSLRSSLIVGAYPAMAPTERQIEAMRLSGTRFEAQYYRDMIVDTIASVLRVWVGRGESSSRSVGTEQ